jgi:hypothetical protein
MKMERDKGKRLQTWIGSIATVVTMLVVLSSMVMAFTVVRETASRAQTTADKALNTSESTARDFAFFKGEVNAKLDNINKNVDRIARVVENMEVVADGQNTNKK